MAIYFILWGISVADAPCSCPSLQLREYYRLKGHVSVRAAKISQELQGLQREQNREKDSVEGMEMRKKEVTMRQQELTARK